MRGSRQQKPKPVLNVLALILGGGRGARLYPLTRDRAKPAVPLLGQYRLIDIPISNCLNSGVNRVYVLTQFNSVSLLRHIANTYKFDAFSKGWVEILPAQQTLTDGQWYQGTADAVRQNLRFVSDYNPPLTLILSGDQLYRMDLSRMVKEHKESNADATICCTPVLDSEVSEFGIVSLSEEGSVDAFIEKPSAETIDPEFAVSENANNQRMFMASMGIYLFKAEVLEKVLHDNPDCDDFGAEIIPRCLDSFAVNAHTFDGYWKDIGTIKSFYQANLEVASRQPVFDLYAPHAPVYTRSRFLPPPKINECHIHDSIIGAGSEIAAESITDSVIGLRSPIGDRTRIDRAIIMGADFYETPKHQDDLSDLPPVGIGPGCVIENCIIDKNPRIGRDVHITGKKGLQDVDKELFSVRDGVIVVPKNTVIPDGTRI
ncbi:MAG: glucose-1-phosphate adenylyltransferase [Planctomycetes bacterium]|nr:glucose-1-phosphate adenylyltransferase [Planctomycetota bacterium]